MLSFLNILKSKTVWTIVGVAAYNILTPLGGTLSPDTKVGMGVNMGAAVLGVLFRGINTQGIASANDQLKQTSLPPVIK